MSYHLTICVPKKPLYLVIQQIIPPGMSKLEHIFLQMPFLLTAPSPTHTHIHYLVNCYLSFIYLPQKIFAEPLGWERSVSSKIIQRISIMKYCHQCYYISNFFNVSGCSTTLEASRTGMVSESSFNL